MYYLFVKKFIITLLVGLAAIIVFTVVIDPYNFFHSPIIKKINTHKTGRKNQWRLAKAIDIISLKPKGIILGSSRVIKIDTLYLKQLTGINYYNCGFPGGSFEEAYAYFLHALHVQPKLESVIIGLDLYWI